MFLCDKEGGGLKSVNPLDRWKNTPYDDSVREGHEKITKFLKEHGGVSGKMVK